MHETPSQKKIQWPDYLQKIEGKVAIKAGVTATLSYILSIVLSEQFDRPEHLISGLWTILTSLVVLQPHVGGTYKTSWLRFLGIFIGSALGAIFTSWFGSSPLPLGISIACTVAICSLLNLSDSFRIAAMSVAVVMVLSGLTPNSNPWMFSVYRFIDSSLGIVVALIVTHTLWPSQATFVVQKNISQCLHLLRQFYLHAASVEHAAEEIHASAEDDLEEFHDLIQENHKTLGESTLELMGRKDGSEHLKILTHFCEDLFDDIAGLQRINKPVLSMIFDDELTKNLDRLIEQTELLLKSLAKCLDKNRWEPISAQHLRESLFDLQNDLVRFRATKTTRKYELQNVEDFFVYFYTIAAIAERILRLRDSIEKLLSP